LYQDKEVIKNKKYGSRLKHSRMTDEYPQNLLLLFVEISNIYSNDMKAVRLGDTLLLAAGLFVRYVQCDNQYLNYSKLKECLMVLFLGEAEVQELLNMDDAVHILEETFRQQGKGNIINHPRNRIKTPKSMLHYLPGAVPHLNVMGYKAYTSSKAGIKFRVFLHDIETGELLSIMDGNYMGMIRTGAAISVATKHMSDRIPHG
jgi:hypothetical protein